MRMPTIHCMDNGKILCGKKNGVYADIKEFQKPEDKRILSLQIASCGKCESILAGRKEKDLIKGGGK